MNSEQTRKYSLFICFSNLLLFFSLCYSATFLKYSSKENDMASDANDITINYEEDDTLIVKELDKEILSKGAWTTILFRYQDFNRGKKEYGPDKYTIRRYQKRNGQYLPKSKFNISSAKQAKMIIETLEKWIDKE